MPQHHRKDDVQRLLYELCVDLGFCLPPQERQRLQQAPPADAHSFTDAVFEAEGMDPPGQDDQLRRQVHERVERHMHSWGTP
ncbi:hypothetical protein ACFZCY_36430 [Streptomyces sp. NPDC007983]|uniref:hypothetical protein n=1 Tax=Streptomyces sp. NPDC007983 TaxID=3364800 RepID=UPI0036EFE919